MDHEGREEGGRDEGEGGRREEGMRDEKTRGVYGGGRWRESIRLEGGGGIGVQVGSRRETGQGGEQDKNVRDDGKELRRVRKGGMRE
jgi:hypothetical protein